MRVLEDLGLAASVRSRGNPLSLIALADGKRRVLSRVDLATIGRELRVEAVAIHRADLHAILTSHLPAGALRLGREYAKHEVGPDGVKVYFSGGEAARADLLVGCDGLGSAVGRAMFGEVVMRYVGQTCWRGVAVGDAEKLTSGGISQFFELWGDGYRCGTVPLDAGRRVLVRDSEASRGAESPVLGAAPESHGHLPGLAYVCVGLPAGDRAKRGDATRSVRLPACCGLGGGEKVILLGDAIHPSTPNLGQGAGMAIESAAVLTRALATCPDHKAAVKTYVRLRHPRTRSVTEESWSAGRVSSRTSGVGQAIRNWSIRRLPAKLVRARGRSLLGYDIYGADLG